MNDKEPYSFICDWCYKEFKSYKPSRYCSKECRDNLKKQEKEQPYRMACINCGKVFDTPKLKKYCSLCEDASPEERKYWKEYRS